MNPAVGILFILRLKAQVWSVSMEMGTNTKKLFIIGAGASGLMAAVSAAQTASDAFAQAALYENGDTDRKDNTSKIDNSGKDKVPALLEITVLEHMDRAGIKLSRTGNGRCNLTNGFIDSTCYQNDNTDFVMHIIRKFDPEDTIRFFNEIGLLTKAKCGYAGTEKLPLQYIYPNSEQASTVVEALLNKALELGIRFEYETYVQSIQKSNNTFIINAIRLGRNITYKADAVIIAAGSKAAPDTGSDGSGYKLAKMLGHSVKKPLPALVQLESSDKVCKTMAGVRSDGSIRIFAGGTEFFAQGELQFTDYGISGIPVFQVSRHAVRALDMRKEVYAVIDLIPILDKDSLYRILMKAAEADKANMQSEQSADSLQNRNNTLFFALGKMMNKKLAAGVMQKLGISQRTRIGRLDGRDIEETAGCVKNFRLDIVGYKSFDRAQICSGGVTLDEFHGDTLESELEQGLYICGELLDVDGICGGYNLQWAWSSGFTAGSSAAKSLCADCKGDGRIGKK